MNNGRFGTGIALSIVAIAAGAVMYWAVTAPAHGFKLSTVGIILMVVGGAGLLISVVLFAMSGSRRTTYDKQAVDSTGRQTSVHEETT